MKLYILLFLVKHVELLMKPRLFWEFKIVNKKVVPLTVETKLTDTFWGKVMRKKYTQRPL